MNLILADTNVWSLAYRSDTDRANPFIRRLRHALGTGTVVTTGLVCLELLRGFTRASTREQITGLFNGVPFIEPTSHDYAAAAELSVMCRRGRVQLETIDALIAQVCIANDLALLTADSDFVHAARHIPLDVWQPT